MKLKLAGIILLIVGVTIFFISMTTKGSRDPLPPESRELRKSSPGWPLYAGALAMASGVFILMGRKRK